MWGRVSKILYSSDNFHENDLSGETILYIDQKSFQFDINGEIYIYHVNIKKNISCDKSYAGQLEIWEK